MTSTENPSPADPSFWNGIIVAKTAAIVILSVASGVAGMLPIKLNDFFRKKSDKASTFDKVMSFLLNFGGGVLICTVFLHLLPEVRDSVTKLENANIISRFVLSYPELIMCIGFFMMFFVEETVHSFLTRTENKNNVRLETRQDDVSVFTIARAEDLKKGDMTIATICHEHQCIKNDCSQKNYNACENGHLGSHHELHESHSHLPNLKKLSLNSFLTVMALSVHEIFEGLAVGLEDETEMVWYLLAAVSCHKVVLAAFIGIQLISSEVKKLVAYLYVLGFALTSPIGIFIGLIVTENSHVNDTLNIVSMVLQAIATGTLLYVVFFEVFRKQFGDYKISGLMRLVASVSGFIFMICIQVLLKDQDDN